MNAPASLEGGVAVPLLRDASAQGEFALRRDAFTDPALFELELAHIFEGTWLYVCHESQIPNPGDYFTTHMGRQPVVLVRGQDRQVRGFINACAHRGAVLCRTRKGTAKFFTCPYHGWVYDTAGKNVEVKDRATGGYPPAFEQQSHDLTALPRVASYRGFVFASLNQDVPSIEEHLAAATSFVDLLAEQSPQGLEVLPGISSYRYRGNWKLQCENGLDGYHVDSVHRVYMDMVARRARMGNDKVQAITTPDLTRLMSGHYSLGNGHIVSWTDVPVPDTRPLAFQRDALEARVGPERLHWMLGRIRNMLLYPNVFLMDQTSTQIRVIRPLAVDLTEVTVYCIAPIGESAAARERRIRQYEDFLGGSGMATPDDLAEFEACQRGYYGAPGGQPLVQGYDRGLGREPVPLNPDAKAIGCAPAAHTLAWLDETHLHHQFRRWRELLGSAAS
jgi:benzoate/toluate 1,2-dioxygenase subunit alpha